MRHEGGNITIFLIVAIFTFHKRAIMYMLVLFTVLFLLSKGDESYGWIMTHGLKVCDMTCFLGI